MNGVTVRIAQSASDFEEFRKLATEYEESLDADLRHADFEEQLASLEQSYSAPHAALLAFSANAAEGCIAFRRLDERTAVVKKLYVRKAARQSGAGRALVAALCDVARERGFRRLVLDTDRERLAAAYRLYRSFGFEDCEPYGKVDYASPTFMQLHL